MPPDFLAAIRQGDRDAVLRMIREDPALVAARDENGASAILLAYYHGHAEVASAIQSLRPDLDLYEAAAVGDAGRIRELAARDRATIDAPASDGFTALGLAAFFKRPDAVRALLELGADPHVASRPAGFTPLHSAVANVTGDAASQIVRMLLAAGADPNAASASGATPLHTAAFTGDAIIARLLVAAGGDARVPDAKGLTPLDVARDRSNSEVAAVLHDEVVGKRL